MVTWQLTIDCKNPRTMVEFWALALGYEVTPPPQGHATWKEYYLSVGVPAEELADSEDASDRLQDPDGEGPAIWFQPVPEKKAGKNRLHLDLYVGPRRQPLTAERIAAVETKTAELVAAGARIVRQDPEHPDPESDDHLHVLMQDPEGNEFCVT